MTGSRVGALIVLIVAAFVVVRTLPLTVARTAMGAGDATMIALKRQQSPPVPAVFAAIASREAALSWVDFAQPLDDAAALYLDLAQRDRVTEDTRNAMLDRSITLQRNALVRGPARPYGWIRLAQAQYLRDPSSDAIVPLLRVSYQAAPAEPRLAYERLKLVYAVRDRLDAAMEDMAARDVRLVLLYGRHRAAEFARDRFAFPWMRDRLRDRPDLEARLIRQFLARPPL